MNRNKDYDAYHNTSLILLNTEDAASSDLTNAKFIFRPFSMKKVRSIGIWEVINFYNVLNCNSYNRSFTFQTRAGDSFDFQLPLGYFTTGTDLAQAIEDLLVSIGGSNYDVQWDITTTINFPRITIVNNAGPNFDFRFANCTTQFSDFTGIVDTSVFNATRTYNYASLLYTPYIDICSRELSKFNNPDYSTSRIPANVICRVYLELKSYNSNDLLRNFSFEFRNIRYLKWDVDAGNSSEIDIQLIDQYGNPLYIPDFDNTNFGLVFMCLTSD